MGLNSKFSRNTNDKVVYISQWIDSKSSKRYGKEYRNIEKKIMLEALKNKEIAIYIQPKYDIKNKKVVGVEALARWIKPNGEIINPCDFINSIEDLGLTVDFDLYMIKEVCYLLEKWSNNSINKIPISVNISRASLEQGNLFISKIKEILEEINFNTEMIELEITESIILYDYEKLTNSISCLRNHGFKIAIDDFGTGGSCLNMLKSVHFDVIKLDKGFLDIDKASINSKIIIKNIVAMIKELGGDIVVEGVENKEYIPFFNNIGCNIIQGYLVSKPMSVYEFENIREFTI